MMWDLCVLINQSDALGLDMEGVAGASTLVARLRKLAFHVESALIHSGWCKYHIRIDRCLPQVHIWADCYYFR